MTDWNKLKVVDLKAELKKRGLPQTGLKPALVARLISAENENESESDMTIQDDASKINPESTTSPDTISPTQTSFETGTEPRPDNTEESQENTIPENNELQTSPEILAEQQTDPTIEPVDLKDAATTSTSATDDKQLPSNETKEEENIQPAQPIDTTEFSLPPSQATSQPPEQPEGNRSAELSVEPREAIEDRQKRKRRSQSPAPTATDIFRKRARPSDSIEEVATSNDDAEWVEKHNAVDTGEINVESKEVTMGEDGPIIVDDSKEEVMVEQAVPNTNEEEANKMDIDIEEPQPRGELVTASPEVSRPRDSRFKNLFSSPQKPNDDTEMRHYSQEPIEDEGSYNPITPAIHPATSALYIRNFVRPLQEPRLHDYLTTLATPPGSDPDPDAILHFHIDRVRTHALVQFKTLSAAARVRSVMHDRVWPDEPNRKALWVDFIPDEKVKEWIDQEQASGPGRNTKKWEVVYEEMENDGDRQVTAILQEATGDPQVMSTRKQSIPFSAPTGPSRGIEGAPSGPRSFGGPRAAPMRNLSELFKSTTTQPTLYWQPASEELVNRRLDAIAAITTKDTLRHTGQDINRYTFEDHDRFVDRGKEIFSGIRPPSGHRGPRNQRSGRFQGRGGGGGRGYGGRGGDRGYDRGYDRGSYDSYRGPPRDQDRRY
ncbi:putative sap domain-containing protein [Botrytis fragariae]|uniref:Putative sap domain-containing protein n=1 Tax=Botrytis fragariae TaxID=1964551 RepID=A0A8H6B2Y1_9HELO|nr:putative sap domain-containing protein [Botrytis fragariae]KAF5878067.1 putative sap domain-containing protein [Botrytis fragariae]